MRMSLSGMGGSLAVLGVLTNNFLGVKLRRRILGGWCMAAAATAGWRPGGAPQGGPSATTSRTVSIWGSSRPTPIHSTSTWCRSSQTPTCLAQERLLIGLVASMFAYINRVRNLTRKRSTPETLVVLRHLHIRRRAGEDHWFLERPGALCHP